MSAMSSPVTSRSQRFSVSMSPGSPAISRTRNTDITTG